MYIKLALHVLGCITLGITSNNAIRERNSLIIFSIIYKVNIEPRNHRGMAPPTLYALLKLST